MTIYQKVIAVVGMLRNSINQRASKIDLAPVFDPTESYLVDYMVVYNDALYRCTQAHTGPWVNADFTRCTVAEVISRLFDPNSNISLVPSFSAGTSYAVGFLVAKDGEFKRCTVAGTGNSAVFETVDLNGVISPIIEAFDSLVSVYGDSTSYKVGKFVLKDGVVKRCTVAGIGAAATFVDATIDDVAKYRLRNLGSGNVVSDDVGIVLYDGEASILDMVSNPFYNADVTVTVTLPEVAGTSGSKIADALLRVDTGANSFQSCSISVDGSPRIVAAASDWNTVELDAINVFTFTYMGKKDNVDVWLAGKVASKNII